MSGERAEASNAPGVVRSRMQAISLWQPWASLIAVGEKWIETRSWETKYRGRIAIHAAKTTKGFDSLPGDCEGTEEAGWRYGYIGEFQVGYCHRTSDEGTRGDTFMVRLEGQPLDARPPLGAVVATATLVDCVPMVAPGSVVGPSVLVADGEAWGWKLPNGPWGEQNPWNYWTDLRPQMPYGDFAPGRWAWLLADVEEIEPVPARGRQQLFEVEL